MNPSTKQAAFIISTDGSIDQVAPRLTVGFLLQAIHDLQQAVNEIIIEMPKTADPPPAALNSPLETCHAR